MKSPVDGSLENFISYFLALPFAIMPFYCALFYILARFYQHAKGKPRAV